jgi:GNAT superfamily N-acetyltransferase
MVIEILDQDKARTYLDDLSEMLVQVVKAGASIGFLDTITKDDARHFWEETIASLSSGRRVWLVAKDDANKVIGTAQFEVGARDNGTHRAEVQKVMVHPEARKQGVARALMVELEQLASEHNLKTLVLDTTLGEAAEKMYSKLGYVRVGEIPDFAVYPDGRLHPTVIFYKLL